MSPNWSVATNRAVWLPFVEVSSVAGPAHPVIVSALVQANEVGTTAPAWYLAFAVGDVTDTTGGCVSIGIAATDVVPSGAVSVTLFGPSPVTITVQVVMQVVAAPPLTATVKLPPTGPLACTVVGSENRPFAPAAGLTLNE